MENSSPKVYRWRLCPDATVVAVVICGVIAIGFLAYLAAPWLWLMLLGIGAGLWLFFRYALSTVLIDPATREVVQKPSLIPRRRGGRWSFDDFQAAVLSSFTFELSTTWTVSLVRRDGSELNVQRSKREGQARRELEEVATALGLPLLDRTAVEPRMTPVSEVASPLAAKLRSKPEEAELLAYILANPPSDAHVSITGEAGEATTIAIARKTNGLRSLVLLLLLTAGTLAYAVAFVRFIQVDWGHRHDLVVLAFIPGIFLGFAWWAWVLRNLSYEVWVEPETVQIRKKVLGVPVWFTTTMTEGVREVLDHADAGKDARRGLTIRSRGKVYRLGTGLSEEQQAWLSAALSAVIASQSEAAPHPPDSDTS